MKLIEEVDFRPLDKIIITFDEFRTYMAPQTEVDKEKSTEEEAVTKIIKKKVKYNQQVAKIIAVPKTEVELSIGDEVLVDFRGCFQLDGYNEVYLIPKYNIIGVMLSSEATKKPNDVLLTIVK